LRWFTKDCVIAHRVARYFACTRANAITEVWLNPDEFACIENIPTNRIIEVMEHAGLVCTHNGSHENHGWRVYRSQLSLTHLEHHTTLVFCAPKRRMSTNDIKKVNLTN
jgi:hypothetical protein